MAKIDYVNIDKIKDLAKSKGISLKYFCDKFGKHRAYLANVRSGANKLDEEELVFIADTLNTTVEYLTDQSDQKEKPTQAGRADYMTQLFQKLSDKNKDILIEVMTKMLEGENNND